MGVLQQGMDQMKTWVFMRGAEDPQKMQPNVAWQLDEVKDCHDPLSWLLKPVGMTSNGFTKNHCCKESIANKNANSRFQNSQNTEQWMSSVMH